MSHSLKYFYAKDQILTIITCIIVNLLQKQTHHLQSCDLLVLEKLVSVFADVASGVEHDWIFKVCSEDSQTPFRPLWYLPLSELFFHLQMSEQSYSNSRLIDFCYSLKISKVIFIQNLPIMWFGQDLTDMFREHSLQLFYHRRGVLARRHDIQRGAKNHC